MDFSTMDPTLLAQIKSQDPNEKLKRLLGITSDGPSPASVPSPSKSAPAPTQPDQLTPTSLAMGGGLGMMFQVSPEEKKIQKELLDKTQGQNNTLESDIGRQRMLERVREYMMSNPQRDITPSLVNLYHMAGIDGSQALAAAKPASPEQLMAGLQGAMKETSNAQDKLSDNELQMLKAKLQFANQKGMMGQGMKQNQYEANYLAKAGGDLDYNSKTARNLFGSSAQTVSGINKIEALVNSYPDPNKMPTNVARDVYTSLAAVLQKGGGNVAESQIDALMPATAKSRFANAQQWLMSEPTGAELKPFLDQVLHSLQAEKQVARQNIQNGFQNIANKHDSSVRMLSPYAQNAWENQKQIAAKNLEAFMNGNGAAAPTSGSGGGPLSPDEWLKQKRAGKIP